MQQRLAAMHEAGDAHGAAARDAEAHALEQAAAEATVQAEQAMQAAEEQQVAAEVRDGCTEASCILFVHAIQQTTSSLSVRLALKLGNRQSPASVELSNAVVDDGVVKADFSRL